MEWSSLPLPKRPPGEEIPVRPLELDDSTAQGLATWTYLPYNYKYPLPLCPWKEVELTRQKCGQSLYRSYPGKAFDLSPATPPSDPGAAPYNALHDPHLRHRFLSRAHFRNLVKKGFLTEDGRVKCRLAEYNRYRLYLCHLWAMQVEQMHRAQVREERARMRSLVAADLDDDPVFRKVTKDKEVIRINEVWNEIAAEEQKMYERGNSVPVCDSVKRWKSYQQYLAQNNQENYERTVKWLNEQTKQFRKETEIKLNAKRNREKKLRSRWEQIRESSRAFLGKMQAVRAVEREAVRRCREDRHRDYRRIWARNERERNAKRKKIEDKVQRKKTATKNTLLNFRKMKEAEWFAVSEHHAPIKIYESPSELYAGYESTSALNDVSYSNSYKVLNLTVEELSDRQSLMENRMRLKATPSDLGDVLPESPSAKGATARDPELGPDAGSLSDGPAAGIAAGFATEVLSALRVRPGTTDDVGVGPETTAGSDIDFGALSWKSEGFEESLTHREKAFLERKARVTRRRRRGAASAQEEGGDWDSDSDDAWSLERSREAFPDLDERDESGPSTSQPQRDTVYHDGFDSLVRSPGDLDARISSESGPRLSRNSNLGSSALSLEDVDDDDVLICPRWAESTSPILRPGSGTDSSVHGRRTVSEGGGHRGLGGPSGSRQDSDRRSSDSSAYSDRTHYNDVLKLGKDEDSDSCMTISDDTKQQDRPSAFNQISDKLNVVSPAYPDKFLSVDIVEQDENEPRMFRSDSGKSEDSRKTVSDDSIRSDSEKSEDSRKTLSDDSIQLDIGGPADFRHSSDKMSVVSSAYPDKFMSDDIVTQDEDFLQSSDKMSAVSSAYPYKFMSDDIVKQDEDEPYGFRPGSGKSDDSRKTVSDDTMQLDIGGPSDFRQSSDKLSFVSSAVSDKFLSIDIVEQDGNEPYVFRPDSGKSEISHKTVSDDSIQLDIGGPSDFRKSSDKISVVSSAYPDKFISDDIVTQDKDFRQSSDKISVVSSAYPDKFMSDDIVKQDEDKPYGFRPGSGKSEDSRKTVSDDSMQLDIGGPSEFRQSSDKLSVVSSAVPDKFLSIENVEQDENEPYMFRPDSGKSEISPKTVSDDSIKLDIGGPSGFNQSPDKISVDSSTYSDKFIADDIVEQDVNYTYMFRPVSAKSVDSRKTVSIDGSQLDIGESSHFSQDSGKQSVDSSAYSGKTIYDDDDPQDGNRSSAFDLLSDAEESSRSRSLAAMASPEFHECVFGVERRSFSEGPRRFNSSENLRLRVEKLSEEHEQTKRQENGTFEKVKTHSDAGIRLVKPRQNKDVWESIKNTFEKMENDYPPISELTKLKEAIKGLDHVEKLETVSDEGVLDRVKSYKKELAKSPDARSAESRSRKYVRPDFEEAAFLDPESRKKKTDKKMTELKLLYDKEEMTKSGKNRTRTQNPHGKARERETDDASGAAFGVLGNPGKDNRNKTKELNRWPEDEEFAKLVDNPFNDGRSERLSQQQKVSRKMVHRKLVELGQFIEEQESKRRFPKRAEVKPVAFPESTSWTKPNKRLSRPDPHETWRLRPPSPTTGGTAAGYFHPKNRRQLNDVYALSILKESQVKLFDEFLDWTSFKRRSGGEILERDVPQATKEKWKDDFDERLLKYDSISSAAKVNGKLELEDDYTLNILEQRQIKLFQEFIGSTNFKLYSQGVCEEREVGKETINEWKGVFEDHLRKLRRVVTAESKKVIFDSESVDHYKVRLSQNERTKHLNDFKPELLLDESRDFASKRPDRLSLITLTTSAHGAAEEDGMSDNFSFKFVPGELKMVDENEHSSMPQSALSSPSAIKTLVSYDPNESSNEETLELPTTHSDQSKFVENNSRGQEALISNSELESPIKNQDEIEPDDHEYPSSVSLLGYQASSDGNVTPDHDDLSSISLLEEHESFDHRKYRNNELPSSSSLHQDNERFEESESRDQDDFRLASRLSELSYEEDSKLISMPETNEGASSDEYIRISQKYLNWGSAQANEENELRDQEDLSSVSVNTDQTGFDEKVVMPESNIKHDENRRDHKDKFPSAMLEHDVSFDQNSSNQEEHSSTSTLVSEVRGSDNESHDQERNFPQALNKTLDNKPFSTERDVSNTGQKASSEREHDSASSVANDVNQEQYSDFKLRTVEYVDNGNEKDTDIEPKPSNSELEKKPTTDRDDKITAEDTTLDKTDSRDLYLPHQEMSRRASEPISPAKETSQNRRYTFPCLNHPGVSFLAEKAKIVKLVERKSKSGDRREPSFERSLDDGPGLHFIYAPQTMQQNAARSVVPDERLPLSDNSRDGERTSSEEDETGHGSSENDNVENPKLVERHATYKTSPFLDEKDSETLPTQTLEPSHSEKKVKTLEVTTDDEFENLQRESYFNSVNNAAQFHIFSKRGSHVMPSDDESLLSSNEEDNKSSTKSPTSSSNDEDNQSSTKSQTSSSKDDERARPSSSSSNRSESKDEDERKAMNDLSLRSEDDDHSLGMTSPKRFERHRNGETRKTGLPPGQCEEVEGKVVNPQVKLLQCEDSIETDTPTSPLGCDSETSRCTKPIARMSDTTSQSSDDGSELETYKHTTPSRALDAGAIAVIKHMCANILRRAQSAILEHPGRSSKLNTEGGVPVGATPEEMGASSSSRSSPSPASTDSFESDKTSDEDEIRQGYIETHEYPKTNDIDGGASPGMPVDRGEPPEEESSPQTTAGTSQPVPPQNQEQGRTSSDSEANGSDIPADGVTGKSAEEEPPALVAGTSRCDHFQNRDEPASAGLTEFQELLDFVNERISSLESQMEETKKRE